MGEAWEARFIELVGGPETFIPRNRRSYWELIAFIFEVATYFNLPDLGTDDAVLQEIENLESHLRWLDRPATRRSVGFQAAQLRSIHGPLAAAPVESDRVDKFLAHRTLLPYLIPGLPDLPEIADQPADRRREMARSLIKLRAHDLREKA